MLSFPAAGRYVPANPGCASRADIGHRVFHAGAEGGRVTDSYGISLADLAPPIDVSLWAGKTLSR